MFNLDSFKKVCACVCVYIGVMYRESAKPPVSPSFSVCFFLVSKNVKNSWETESRQTVNLYFKCKEKKIVYIF